MFIDRVFDMWNTAECKMASNNPPCATREEYLKKLLMYKGKPFSLDKLRTRLQAESAEYDEERLIQFTILKKIFDAFEKYFETNDFPNHVENLDTFIKEVVNKYDLLSQDKVVKVMPPNKLLELYPTKTLRDETITYSPSELFSMFGVFSSVYLPNKSYILDRENYDGIICLEDNAHIDLLISLPHNNSTNRYLAHIKYLADNNELKFNIPYILPTHWKHTGKGVSLNIKYNNKNIFISDGKLKKVESTYDTYYVTKVRVKDYYSEIHLLC